MKLESPAPILPPPAAPGPLNPAVGFLSSILMVLGIGGGAILVYDGLRLPSDVLVAYGVASAFTSIVAGLTVQLLCNAARDLRLSRQENTWLIQRQQAHGECLDWIVDQMQKEAKYQTRLAREVAKRDAAWQSPAQEQG